MAAGTKRSPSPWPFPQRAKKVRFFEDLQPSQIRLTVVFGPKSDPKLTIRIKIGIDEDHKPTVKVDFARGKKGARPRSRSRTPPRSQHESDDEREKRRSRRSQQSEREEKSDRESRKQRD
ncbi:hypothetical protein B9Z65_5722 [Elsinoe australis]|uniref:Uncharacterized protein n=1 Tax=Elsinoe australis TaxID=40998 RepID=A0A2P7YIZ2_9PEZI|nr:hypothetical protein B9Z65_5722 [Elsinoe australis]